MKTFTFDVTQRFFVQIDETKFSDRLMTEFNSCISDYGTGDDALVLHGERIARLAAAGYDFDPRDFVEGYGIVSDAGIAVSIEDHISVDCVSIGRAGA